MAPELHGIDPRDRHICLREDEPPSRSGPSPTSAPIVQTSLFTFPSFDALIAGLDDERHTHVYTRGQNPTVEALERKIAELERAQACKCFGSGMAAISAVLFGILRAGDHVLFVNRTYGPTLELARALRSFGVSHDVTLDTDPEAVRASLRPGTRLVWLESPGTLLFGVADVAAIAAAARDGGALTCMDNSWSTPLLQKPLTAGVDLVVHTCTKYIGGHSDLVAGAVAGSAERIEELFYRSYLLLGATLAPATAWLLLRSLRTLPLRLTEHGAAGLRVARFLAGHPAVARVHHPALEADEALLAQLAGFSGLFSFELADPSFAALRGFLDALEVFRLGISWGGAESLAYSPCRAGATPAAGDTPVDAPAGDGAGGGDAERFPDGLVRLSVGLEGADVLIEDLDRALAAGAA